MGYSRSIFLSLIVITMAACATTESVREAPTDDDRVYYLEADCATARKALPGALKALRLKVEAGSEQSPEDGCPVSLVVRKPVSAFSWGELVRVSLDTTSNGGTSLGVHTERVLATNVTARGDWSMQIRDALLAEIASHR